MSNVSPTAGAEWRRHWPVVAATTSGMSLAAMLTASFGVMLAPIEAEFGWTRAQISSGPAVVSMMGLLGASLAGYFIDRLGARRVGIAVVLIMCSAVALMSTLTDSLWHWWGLWAFFGIAAMATSTVWLMPVSTIFRGGRGMAIAVTISGTGISMALAPLIAEYFVQNHSWRMGFVALGAIWFVVTMPLVLAFVPKHIASTTNATEETPSPGELEGLTPAQGFRSRNFYLLFFASLVSSVTGVALILNLVPVLIFTGLTRIDAVWIAGSMGVASIIGRLAGGWLMDRFDVRKLAIVASILSAAFPLSLLLAPGVVWAAMIGVAAYGLTGGMKMNAIVYLVSTMLGARSFGLFYGTISITTSVAMGVGPLIANHIYDRTQSYTPVIWAAIPGFLASAFLFSLLRPQGSERPAPAPLPDEAAAAPGSAAA